MVAQVGLSSFLVTGTPRLDCQVPSAAAVSGPNLPSAVTPMTFCASTTSAPMAPCPSSGYPLAVTVGVGVGVGAGGVVEPVGPVSGLVTATPLHHEVRW